MRKFLFLYRLKENDRDCCAYIDAQSLRWECNHYFGRIGICGACYCGGKFAAYDEIETILTKDEYEELIAYSNAINELGYGIIKGEKRYQEGIRLSEGIQHVYNKLVSEEALDFQSEIIEKEIMYMSHKYKLSRYDIEEIFNYYTGEYRDRSIISYVYDDVSDVGYNEAWSLGYIKKGDEISEKYFNYEKFGEDLVEDSYRFMELHDGRVVSLNY